MRKINKNSRSYIFITSIITWLALWTIGYHFLEHWSYIKSFYFSVITITTIGYGDLHPTTELSRLFTALYALSGTAIVITALWALGTDFLEKKVQKNLEKTNKSDTKKRENKEKKRKLSY